MFHTILQRSVNTELDFYSFKKPLQVVEVFFQAPNANMENYESFFPQSFLGSFLLLMTRNM